MTIALKPYNSAASEAGYIGWTPIPLHVTSGAAGESGILKLTSHSMLGGVTKVVFLADRDSPPQSEIDLDITPGQEKIIYIAGEFQAGERHNGASVDGKDVKIEARWLGGDGTAVAEVDIMIRVRRNANELSDKAREDLLFALARLNGIPVDGSPNVGAGQGIYVSDFVGMHVSEAGNSQHGDSHFVPWHRLYLLDLERLLQAERPTVTIPYWRFDEPAPNLFTRDFMGEMDVIDRDSRAPGAGIDGGGFTNTPLARFSVTNHLSSWQIGDVQGIPRAARFDPMSEAAAGVVLPDGRNFPLFDQQRTLRMGGGVPPGVPADAQLGTPGSLPGEGFARMEGTPHGAAHLSFNGRINSVPVAPQDPLFFLLHCNVDRLWAVWQSIFDRDEPSDVRTYPYQNPGDSEPWTIVDATQWPWDGSVSEPDNPLLTGILPPGTRKENFEPSSLVSNFVNNVPKLQDAIDPYGHHDESHYVGFAYDDVPYNHAPAVSN